MKNNRGANHPGTEAKALGALCAKKLGGANAYTKFYTAVFDGSDTAGNVYPVANLPTLAQSLGLNVTAWQSCVDNKDTLAEFTAETAEAQSLGLAGTPGTLLVNRQTGQYVTVEGAYPYDTFTGAINALRAPSVAGTNILDINKNKSENPSLPLYSS